MYASLLPSSLYFTAKNYLKTNMVNLAWKMEHKWCTNCVVSQYYGFSGFAKFLLAEVL